MSRVVTVHIAIVNLIFFTNLYSQNDYEVYIDPNKGNRVHRREGLMNGNQVETVMSNWGTIGRAGGHPYSGAWPRNTGHDHVSEMTLIVSGRVTNEGNQYTIATDAMYGGEVDPDGSTEWSWQPLPGYASVKLGQDTLAINTRSGTWPKSWPGRDFNWNGNWNGYFGLGIENASMECLYVIDDSKNAEFDFYPDPADKEMHGLGLQVETRMFQWVHPLAEDAIFVHYAVTNVGQVTYGYDNPIFFGMFADTHPGGNGSSDDDSFFDLDENMVYAWDHDNLGRWLTYTDILPGYLGWKFLESPGIGDDQIDNDRDGLLDERRDNDAGSFLFGPVGKYDIDKWHWEGDEDGDWNETIDDLGSDGVGIFDEAYPGPDSDGTEGNKIPDQGEPNFGITDNDESDQIGLTAFVVRRYGSIDASNDEMMFQAMSNNEFDTEIAQTVNNVWIYSSGTFPLKPKKTERFSLALMFGDDIKDIFRNAVTAQRIYDSDYRFAKPPDQPTLTALPGDKKVVLYWDTRAEQSRDPIYGFDFEGYKIFKSTDPGFLEAKLVTGGFGNPRYMKAYRTYDIDNGLRDLHPVALGEEQGEEYNTGAHYFMGKDTGLRHSFIDKDVVNGMTYYYALAAYDRGYDHDFFEKGWSDIDSLLIISPTESPYTIKVEGGEITSLDRNCAVIIPSSYSAGYVDPYEGLGEDGNMLHIEGKATGNIKLDIFNPYLIPSEHTIQITFSDSVDQFEKVHDKSANVIDITSGETILSISNLNEHDSTKVHSGMTISFREDTVSYKSSLPLSRWNNESEMNKYSRFLPYASAKRRVYAPIDIDIVFYDTAKDSAWDRALIKKHPAPFKIINKTSQLNLEAIFNEGSRNGKIDPVESIRIIKTYMDNENKLNHMGYWVLNFTRDTDGNYTSPAEDDTFKIRTIKQFRSNDIYEFTMHTLINQQAALNELEKIKVVPNPYVATSSWEQKSTTTIGRGERKIQFTHLPQECTIRILTINGYLVDTINHQGDALNGSEFWDLRSKDNMDIAFGIYLYHIEAPGLGEKTGKFAIIK